MIIADSEGSFTLAKNILEPEKTQICIVKTKCSRFKDMKCIPIYENEQEKKEGLVTISTDGKICFWSIESLR